MDCAQKLPCAQLLQCIWQHPAATPHGRSIAASLCRANAFCHSRLQTRMAVASHHIDQRLVSVKSAIQPPKCGAAPIPSVFHNFYFELWLQSGAHFADLIFQKCHAPADPAARCKSLIKRSATLGATLPEKKHTGFAHESVFTSEFM